MILDVKLMEGFFDTEYFIEGYVSMKPHWRGLGKSHIYFLPKRKVWRLESFYATEKYADLTADDTDPFAYYPLGRLNWKIEDGICQMSEGAVRSLTLTTCFPNKFTCDDGSCVRINQRCNLVVDCPDKSDEKVRGREGEMRLNFSPAGLRDPETGRQLPRRTVP